LPNAAVKLAHAFFDSFKFSAKAECARCITQFYVANDKLFTIAQRGNVVATHAGTVSRGILHGFKGLFAIIFQRVNYLLFIILARLGRIEKSDPLRRPSIAF
jgi:hypothetical protein